MNKKLSCPDCGSMEVKVGRQTYYARLSNYPVKLFNRDSDIEYYFCAKCGTVIKQVVLNPERFNDYEQ
ncbi:hypothetical protein [Holzapfeliella floricola]|nr:hypothetical protein [Holzapfeliella floricola]